MEGGIHLSLQWMRDCSLCWLPCFSSYCFHLNDLWDLGIFFFFLFFCPWCIRDCLNLQITDELFCTLAVWSWPEISLCLRGGEKYQFINALQFFSFQFHIDLAIFWIDSSCWPVGGAFYCADALFSDGLLLKNAMSYIIGVHMGMKPNK